MRLHADIPKIGYARGVLINLWMRAHITRQCP
jgi:hypothetical protein